MTQQLNPQVLAEKARVLAQPPQALLSQARHPTTVDRSFELPGRLYVATVALFLGFIGVMALGFGNPELAIPLAIFAFFIVAGFGVPAVWTSLAPDSPAKRLGWGRFMSEGVMTGSGRASGRDATVQVLILPVLIFFWGVCAVVIAALV